MDPVGPSTKYGQQEDVNEISNTYNIARRCVGVIPRAPVDPVECELPWPHSRYLLSDDVFGVYCILALYGCFPKNRGKTPKMDGL